MKISCQGSVSMCFNIFTVLFLATVPCLHFGLQLPLCISDEKIQLSFKNNIQIPY